LLSRYSIRLHAPWGPCAVESHLFVINSQPLHNPCNFTVSHTPFHSCRHVKRDHYHAQKDPPFLRSTKPKSDTFNRKPQASNPKTKHSNREPTNCMPRAAHDVPQTTNILSNSTSLIPRNGSNALHATVLPLSPYVDHSNSSNQLLLTPYETSNELGADLLCVLDLPATDYQSQRPMKRQIPTTRTHYASHCNFVAKVICVFIVVIICPSSVVAEMCPVSSNSASTCAGIFHTRSDLVPMIHMNECPSACVAVTYTAYKALQAAVAVEITWIVTIRKSSASQITLDGGICLVDGTSLSLVNANTSNKAGFSIFYCNNVTACTAPSQRLPLLMHVRDTVEVMGTSLILSARLSSSHCMTFACSKVVTYAVGIEDINEPTQLSGRYVVKGCCYTALHINCSGVRTVSTPQSARQLHYSDSHAVLRAISPPFRTDPIFQQKDSHSFDFCPTCIAPLIFIFLLTFGLRNRSKRRPFPVIGRNRDSLKYTSTETALRPKWVFWTLVRQVLCAFLLQPVLLLLVTLHPSTVLSQTPPITAGLVGYYNADSWTGANWTDLSGAGNHVTEIGGSSIAVARPVGAPAYVYGASTAWMKFPTGILPANYTLLYVARHNGPTRGRIFKGFDANAVLGFYQLSTMLLFSCGKSLSATPAVPNSEWIPVSVRSDSLRFFGTDITSNRSNGCTDTVRLAINIGPVPADVSDFAIRSVLVYNVKLSDTDVQRVETWFSSALQTSFTPGNLQVCAHEALC
jgi:hypothetical protein